LRSIEQGELQNIGYKPTLRATIEMVPNPVDPDDMALVRQVTERTRGWDWADHLSLHC
jgi:hypothetical protein